MGPSGSGKTSLLTALAGRVPAGSKMTITGSVTANGSSNGNGNGNGEGGRRQAFVQQEDIFYSMLTVEEVGGGGEGEGGGGEGRDALRAATKCMLTVEEVGRGRGKEVYNEICKPAQGVTVPAVEGLGVKGMQGDKQTPSGQQIKTLSGAVYTTSLLGMEGVGRGAGSTGSVRLSTKGETDRTGDGQEDLQARAFHCVCLLLHADRCDRTLGRDGTLVGTVHVLHKHCLPSNVPHPQTLRMAAELRLPQHMTGAQKDAYVQHLMGVLGLSKVAGTRVGDDKNRGLSGGGWVGPGRGRVRGEAHREECVGRGVLTGRAAGACADDWGGLQRRVKLLAERRVGVVPYSKAGPAVRWMREGLDEVVRCVLRCAERGVLHPLPLPSLPSVQFADL